MQIGWYVSTDAIFLFFYPSFNLSIWASILQISSLILSVSSCSSARVASASIRSAVSLEILFLKRFLKAVQDKTVVRNFEWLKKHYFLSADFQANSTDICWQKVVFFSHSKLCTYCSYLGRPLFSKKFILFYL